VVHDFVYLRQEPSLHAPILGKRQRGDTFHASEETWDGWVKLHGQPGSLTFYLLVLSREWGTGMIIDSYCGSFLHSPRFTPVSLEKEKVNPNGLQNSHRTNRRTAGNMITLSVTSFTPPTSSSGGDRGA
jgi:hypothetical protein